LGSDKIFVYHVKTNEECGETLVPNDPPFIRLYAGCMPRHMVLDDKELFLYIITEGHGSVDQFSISKVETKIEQEKNENEQEKNIINLKFDRYGLYLGDFFRGRGSADIHISHDGEYLYTSHRDVGLGEDKPTVVDNYGGNGIPLISDQQLENLTPNSETNSRPKSNCGITIFKRHQETGQLHFLQFQRTARHPRNFAISPCDNYVLVACRDDDVVQVFKRDIKTGLLTLIDEIYGVEKPVCVQFSKF
jgi:6-phosphogluconolactonase (cycloisomerase 2 family)